MRQRRGLWHGRRHGRVVLAAETRPALDNGPTIALGVAQQRHSAPGHAAALAVGQVLVQLQRGRTEAVEVLTATCVENTPDGAGQSRPSS